MKDMNDIEESSCSLQRGQEPGPKAEPPWKTSFDRKTLGRQKRASEMAQQVKALASKPNNLSSIPETSMVGGKNQLLQTIP